MRLVISPTRADVPFVNADVIAARRWPHDPARHAYQAAEIAASTRAALIQRGEPFVAETVFSHPSKLDLIRDASAAGYYVALHVVMIPVELAVERVAARVTDGGHDVPVEKIRARFDRLWGLVADAVLLADTATFYDNTRRSGPTEVALFSIGVPIGAPFWPAWTPPVITQHWPGRDTG